MVPLCWRRNHKQFKQIWVGVIEWLVFNMNWGDALSNPSLTLFSQQANCGCNPNPFRSTHHKSPRSRVRHM